MSSYTVIFASKMQADKLFTKHMKPFLCFSKIIQSSYSYDSEDNIGFVELWTATGKTISYQLRNNIPMFIGFTGFGNIRYDICYPEELNKDMYDMLKSYGIKSKNKFWKGGYI